MYLVLDSTLETIEFTADSTVNGPPNQNLPQAKLIQTENIVVGASKRSRNGCLACRQRKKKCDESYPTCGSCNHRNVECIWRNNSKFKVQKLYSSPKDSIIIEKFTKFKNNIINTTNVVSSKTSSDSITSSSKPRSLPSTMVASSSSSSSTSSSSPEDDDFGINLNNMDESVHHNYFELQSTTPPYANGKNNTELLMLDISNYYPSPVTNQIFNPFKHMDERGTYFIDAFVNKVATKLCIGPASCNYFLKTFYQLAETEESISYALSSWGGLFVEGYTEGVRSYLGKAFQLIKDRYNTFENLPKEDIYILLNFFLIGIGIQICAGDVSKWNILFKKCIEMIQQNGGITEIFKMFDYSNDVKWLIADVEFHDVMSSGAFTSGTLLPIKEYDTIINQHKLLELGGYGLDPLQGCISSMYLLFGEIATVNAELNEKRQKLDKLLKRAEKKYEQQSKLSTGQTTQVIILKEDGEEIDLRSTRLDYYQEVEDHYNHLKQKILDCQPNVGQMSHIIDDKTEVEFHLTLFEVYSFSCQLCLNYQIKGTPPASSEMQSILLNALNSLDILVDTKMVSSLAMSLLLCGIACCTPLDRIEMENRFTKIKSHYEVANVTRVLDIVHEVWNRNQNGELWVDWIEICREKNWDLCVC
ncbi:putative transcriptional regulator [Scheffersomyces coipomensis]|uniref:putative transcriptional regulator n=1 Tax=Scheffersomyces coipomensis TaxID=1788519 RepID=UPI00315D91F0